MIYKNSGVIWMFSSVKQNLHVFMFSRCCHFLKLISVTETVFFINPGSQDWTARRPHHFLETIFCFLNPNYTPDCLETLCWGVPGDHWGWAIESRYWTALLQPRSAFKHWIATLLHIWKVACVISKGCSKNTMHGTVEKVVVLQSYYSVCEIYNCSR